MYRLCLMLRFSTERASVWCVDLCGPDKGRFLRVVSQTLTPLDPRERGGVPPWLPPPESWRSTRWCMRTLGAARLRLPIPLGRRLRWCAAGRLARGSPFLLVARRLPLVGALRCLVASVHTTLYSAVHPGRFPGGRRPQW